MTDPYDRTPRPSELATAIAGLGESLRAMAAQSEGLRVDLVAAEQSRQVADRERLAAEKRHSAMIRTGTTLTVVIAALAALSLVLSFAAYRISAKNNQLNREVRSVSEHLRDCATPGGNCYGRSQARTGAAVRRVQLTQLYIVQCSRELPDQRGPEFDRRFEACVERRLERAAAEPTPSPSPTRPMTPAPSPTRPRR